MSVNVGVVNVLPLCSNVVPNISEYNKFVKTGDSLYAESVA